MDLTVIIVNYNTKELLSNCLKSIFNKKWRHSVQVIVVDNHSADGSARMVKNNFPQVTLIESEKNLGFAAGNNLGLGNINSKYALLLNSDTETLAGSFDNLVDFAKENDFGIASCKLIDKEGNFQPNAGELPSPLPLFLWLSGLDDILKKIVTVPSYQARDLRYYKKDRQTGWVSGAAMLIKKEVLEKIGLLDQTLFMYAEDVEYCLRAKRSGIRVGWTSCASIIHLGGKSSDSPKYRQWLGEFKGLLYIYRKYYGLLSYFILKLFFYKFIMLRALTFLLLGKISYSGTYAKVFFNL